MRNLSAPEDGDRVALARILSDPLLLSSLYPQSRRIPDVRWVVEEWSSLPPGEGDVQRVVRSATGDLRGCVRLEENRLAYFVDPHHWGRGYGRFMLQSLADNVLLKTNDKLFQAFVQRENRASIRLLEGVGFGFAGVSSEYPSSKTLLRYTLRTAP